MRGFSTRKEVGTTRLASPVGWRII